MAAGVEVTVFTHPRMAHEVRTAGAAFADLYAGVEPQTLDTQSRPFLCRYVPFAASRADEVVRQTRRLAPDVVMSHAYAVIGHVVAAALGRPHVIVRAGHSVPRDQLLSIMQRDSVVADICRNAAARLREDWEMRDASPFSFIPTASPDLNVCPEPEEFLRDEVREALQPLACYGSLVGDDLAPERLRDAPQLFAPDARLRVYVAFGCAVWTGPRRAELMAALETIVTSLQDIPGTDVLVGMGGAEIEPAMGVRLSVGGARIEREADQWNALAQADLFVTANGVNSTHEALFHQVPMLSYPIWGEQPLTARRCHELGLSVPLALDPLAPIDRNAVRAGLERLRTNAVARADRLSVAGRWERAAVDGRAAVVQRIVALADRERVEDRAARGSDGRGSDGRQSLTEPRHGSVGVRP